MTYNALGLSTLVVGECPKDTLPLARDCSAIEVTKTNVALARRLYPAGASIRSYTSSLSSSEMLNAFSIKDLER